MCGGGEFVNGMNFYRIHLDVVFGHYKTEETVGWDAKNAFEGVQSDVEPTTSIEDAAKIIQVIWEIIRAFCEVIQVGQDEMCQVVECV